MQGLTHYEINDNNEFLIVDLITKDNWSRTIEISERTIHSIEEEDSWKMKDMY